MTSSVGWCQKRRPPSTASPHGVMRADVSRLLYLYVEGGWYSDTDYYWVRDPTDLVKGRSIVLPTSRDGGLEGLPRWGTP